MRRHGHNRARAVFHQHEIGDPNRNPLVRERIDRIFAREDALFFSRLVRPHRLFLQADFVDELQHGGLVRRSGAQAPRHRMFRRKHHERRAEQRVRPRRENLDMTVAVSQWEQHGRAVTLADPVALHGQHALRPALLKLLATFQQFVGVIGDAHVPLLKLALPDGRMPAPAFIPFNLLVRQRRVAFVAPVDDGFFLVEQPFFVDFQEQPLLPFVIEPVARRHFPIPIIAEPKLFQLVFHVGDIVARPFGRMLLMFHRRVFGGQAE